MFWDSSAVVPLIVPSPQSTTLTDHLAADRGVTVWRGTAVECAAALYRSHREESIGQAALDAALLRLHAFTEDADTVAPGEFVRRRASELVAIHRLRAADAFQLAAALAVGAALVGSVLRFNAMQLMGAVGVGIAAGAGTGIVTGLVGTAIV